MISKTINRTTRLALCFLKTGELSPVFLILKQKRKAFIMKRILSLLLIICMMTVMVVGCGDTQTETSDTTDTVETTTEATTTT